jgi:CHAT domain-containing protein
MRAFLLIAVLLCALVSQQALAQQNEKAARVAELNIKLANLIIQGKGKVGKDISVEDALDITWSLETKQNQPQLALNLALKIYNENPKIKDIEKWFLLDTVVKTSAKLSKKQFIDNALGLVLAEIKAGSADSDISNYVIREAYELAEKSAENMRFALISSYVTALVRDAQNGKLKFKEQEVAIPWAFDEFYALDLGYQLQNDPVQMHQREIQRYELARNYFLTLKGNSFSRDEKLYLVAATLVHVIGHESFNNAKDLVSIAEPLLFVETKNQEALLYQLVVLGRLMPRDDYYLSNKNPDELMSFIEAASARSTSLNSKFGTAMFLGNTYSERGQFDKADVQFEIALKSIDYKNDLKDINRGLKLVINALQLKSLNARGDLNQVIEKTPGIYKEINWFLNDLIKKHPQQTSMAGGFVLMIDIQTFLGNYKEATEIGEKILSVLEAGRLNGIDVNTAIYQIASSLQIAYDKLGNESRARELRLIQFRAELRAQKIPTSTFMAWYWGDLLDGDYGAAEESLKRIEKNIGSTSRSSDTKVMVEFIKTSRQLIADLKKADKNQKEVLLQKNCDNLLEIFGSQLDEIKATGNAGMYLTTLSYAFNLAVCGSDQTYAGYIAKLYVNTLQELRINLSDRRSQLGIFTAARADTLKNFVNNFYEIGDYQAAQLTMRILKENEFLDFLNTRSDKDLILSTIEYSPLEKEFNLKKDQIEKEIQSLNARYKNTRDQKEQDLIQLAINEKLINLKNINDTFRQSLKRSYVNKENKKDLGTVRLGPNDAQLDYVIEKSKLTLYVYTDKAANSYTYEIPREKLRTQILELNLALSKKKVPEPILLSLLSKELMIDKINDLKAGGIKTLKIRSDDLLPIIPLALLAGEKGKLGENFNLIFLGLGRNEIKTGIGNSMSAFGVTKPSKQYSALPFVKEEILSLQNMTLPAGRNIERNIYLDSSFTKSALVSSFDKGDAYLHIATHYSIPGTKNNAGQLLLGDGNTFSLNDMRSEIKKNNNIRLITLSACDTGVISKAQGSSNLEGLSNVLNLKGAKAVMGTLWPISDEATALFMKLFYGYIFKGGSSPEEALRLTQSAFSRGSLGEIKDNRAMIDGSPQEFDSKLKKYTNPFYWAAFQLIGS